MFCHFRTINPRLHNFLILCIHVLKLAVFEFIGKSSMSFRITPFRATCLLLALALNPSNVSAREALILKGGEYVAVPYELYAKSRALMYREDVEKTLERSRKNRVNHSPAPLSIRFSKDPSNDSPND